MAIIANATQLRTSEIPTILA
jgi:septal ring factor EnvC (AmiA/AmiB activator)